MEELVPCQEMDLTRFVRLNIKFLQAVGYFLPEFAKSSTRIIYLIYAIIFVSVAFILCLLSQVTAFIRALGDIEQMTQVSFLLLTNIVQCFKLSCFIFHGSKIWELIHDMNRTIFQPRNKAQRKILLDEVYKTKLITKLFLLACTLTCMVWAIAPFLDKSGSGGLRLPLGGWYPFSTEGSPAFEFVYVYQIFATWISGIGDISMDTFMAGTIIFISGQLSVLNYELENLKCRDKQLLNDNLIRSAIHYKSIIEFADKVTYLFTSAITAQFMVGAFIVCMSMFQMTLVSIPSFSFFAMLLYQICMLTEIYLLCYFGNEVIAKSDRLTQSAYMSEWIDAPDEFKKNLIIFMTRTQFPFTMQASGFFPLSLKTFKAITKSSWSYFALLNQVHHRSRQ